MIDSSAIKLLDLIPPNFRDSPHIKALSAAIDAEFPALIEYASRVLIYPAIENLDHKMLDALAAQFDTVGYSVDYSLDLKRKIVGQSLIIAMTAGTVGAVERQVTAIFGDATVSEWFEYGGSPGYFKITTTNPAVTTDHLDEVIRVISRVKRFSSWLDEVILELEAEFYVYKGFWLHTGTFVTLPLAKF